MEFSRNERVGEEIKKAVSEIINNELKDPRIEGLISVTKVDLTKDLRHAKIYLSIFGDEQTKNRTFEAIKNAEGFIRRGLASRIRLRFIPEISLKIDDSIQYGIKISKLLDQVNKNTFGDEND